MMYFHASYCTLGVIQCLLEYIYGPGKEAVLKCGGPCFAGPKAPATGKQVKQVVSRMRRVLLNVFGSAKATGGGDLLPRGQGGDFLRVLKSSPVC